MKKIFEFVLFVLGIFLVIVSIFSAAFEGIHIANFVLMVIGAVFFAFKYIPSGMLKKIYTIAVCIGCIVFFSISLVIVIGIPELSKMDDDAVIVLGCSVIGDEPSNSLSERAEKACEYYLYNKNVIFVLSGSRGRQENITEAAALKKLILQGGVPEKNIIIEDKATSTTENFRFSKMLLDEYFGSKDYSTAFITNDYHCYRAAKLAEYAGFENIKCYPAPTPLSDIILSYVREVMAVIKLWIFKY